MVNTLIVVTGSRSWTRPELIIAALNDAWVNAVVVDLGELHVMHGACPTGADRWAHRWCLHARFPGVVEQPRPADWDRYGKSAGHRRNAAMVREAVGCEQVGWKVRVAAFIRNNSRGATGCRDLAERAGLETVTATWGYADDEGG